jgi:hypothetical protein
MHAWTLWSVGQISSNDVINGLNKYDELSLKAINLTGGSEIMINKNISTKMINNG